MNKPRKLLFPFSVLYDGITTVRNLLYDRDIFQRSSYEVPVICVGNLNVGGTGKSPMTEYIISVLKKDYKIAVLSRGYKRETKGFQFVEKHHSVKEVGDEPLQFKLKYPDIIVSVDANRKRGIEKLKTLADVIVMDDAMQHRRVKPSFTILLTAYNDLYINDLLLPAGNLRESKKGAQRADVIVVTKCPANLSYAKQQQIQFDLHPEVGQPVYFASVSYASVIQGRDVMKHIEYLSDTFFTLVTGIANATPMVEYLNQIGLKYEHLNFADHHNFSVQELRDLDQKGIILTTEKDFMRLKDKIQKAELYYLPIATSFLNKEEGFVKRLKNAAAGSTTKEIEKNI